MLPCLFASDLHGHGDRYRKLLAAAERERPGAIFLGGDLLPSGLATLADSASRDFVRQVLQAGFAGLRDRLGAAYPAVFVILGNDDPRREEAAVAEGDRLGPWHYVHDRCLIWHRFTVCGYNCVPPTPFMLKDWERYDVSRYVDPGCLSPEDGWRTWAVDPRESRYGTMQDDLERIAGTASLEHGILLLHAPPHATVLDRIQPRGVVDHAPADPHVGSIAVRRFIESRQPLVTLHGHVHESARLTGSWSARLGRTVALSAAHDGPELALVRFDAANPGAATRELL